MVAALPRVEEAKAAVRDGLIRFHPERWSKVYLHWLENIQDWCISRQLWWGHRIPVWYRKGLDRDQPDRGRPAATPPRCSLARRARPIPENWEQEEDVLDTWASSWLWPFATMGWPDPGAMKAGGLRLLLSDERPWSPGPDIIFFWVARMIMAGLEFARPGRAGSSGGSRSGTSTSPGSSATRRAARCRSRSAIRPIPLDLIDNYGADGLRFGDRLDRAPGPGHPLPGGPDRGRQEFLQQALERLPLPADERARRATTAR